MPTIQQESISQYAHVVFVLTPPLDSLYHTAHDFGTMNYIKRHPQLQSTSNGDVVVLAPPGLFARVGNVTSMPVRTILLLSIKRLSYYLNKLYISLMIGFGTRNGLRDVV